MKKNEMGRKRQEAAVAKRQEEERRKQLAVKSRVISKAIPLS